MHWRQQGDRGEWSAMNYFADRGAALFHPVGHSPDVDFVACLGDRTLRVQVKSCTSFHKGRWAVTTCTRGGNQSWNGVVKRLDARRFDVLFVVVADGRRWCIPAAEVDGRAGVRLGGPVYARFEVAPGRRLDLPDLGGAPELESRAGL